MSKRLKDIIENDPSWEAVALALVDYRVGTDQCFSSGEIARDMRVTLGARYTRDERDVDGSTLAFSGTTPSLVLRASQSASICRRS